LLFFVNTLLTTFQKKGWKLCLAVHWCFFQIWVNLNDTLYNNHDCMHARAVALLTWQCTKLHALLQWQVLKLNWVNDEQTSKNSNNRNSNSNSNNNNKARCIPAELCKLLQVKTRPKIQKIWANGARPSAANIESACKKNLQSGNSAAGF
jgi:hypothetical protein